MTATTKPSLVRIRVVGTDKFVGKRNPSYALQPDGFHVPLDPEAHWFTSAAHAHVWTDQSALRRLMSMAAGRPYHKATFKQFEVLFPDGETMPLDDFVAPKIDTGEANDE